MRWTALIVVLPILTSCEPHRKRRPTLSLQRGSVAAVEQQRLTAFRNDDKVTFRSLVYPDLTVIDSNGEISSLADELASMRPSTLANPLPELGLENVTERYFASTAILTGSLVERHGTQVVLHLRFTNTYVLDRTRWKLAASQLTNAGAE